MPETISDSAAPAAIRVTNAVDQCRSSSVAAFARIRDALRQRSRDDRDATQREQEQSVFARPYRRRENQEKAEPAAVADHRAEIR
jgi:hypothetical protein